MISSFSGDKDFFSRDCLWRLQINSNGYKNCTGQEIVTQAFSGRVFKVIDKFSVNIDCDKKPSRLKVRLLEDGYICWLDTINLANKVVSINSWDPIKLNQKEINKRLHNVLRWIERAYQKENKYLWGGSIGPDFDCSGLVQSAFASQLIWLPRDAYQQENFCKSLNVNIDNIEKLKPADLLFFGSEFKCDHVGIYRGEGLFWHSSGVDNGRNGIGCDSLHSSAMNPVSIYYRCRLRGAGRVDRCHDGTTLA